MAIRTSNQITFTEQKKILEIQEWYLATSVNEGITSSDGNWGTWTSEVQTIDGDKPYLWNYEKVIYSLGDPDISDPILIGYYATSADNKYIENIANQYCLTEDLTSPEDTDWTDSSVVTGLNSTNRYLWNREIIKYTDGTEQPTEPAIIGVYSDSGTTTVDFQIYSVDGFEFSDAITSIELKTVVFQAGVNIADKVTYCWKWWNAESESESDDKYEAIEGQTGPSLIINQNDAYAYSAIKCEITYNDIVYEDYVSLTYKDSIYTATVKFFNGHNMIATGENYLIAYVELYKNNSPEELLLAGNVHVSNRNGISSGIVTTDISATERVDGKYMYFACKSGSEYNVVLGQYSGTAESGQWNVVPSNYVYKNNIFSNTTSPVVLIPKEKISKALDVSWEISKDDVIIARTSAIVMDLNDPIVSNSAPSNPQKGQLWLDTSETPSLLKMYDGEKWVNSGYQDGNVVHTSKPVNGYTKGDLWILADGETCKSVPFTVTTSTDTSGWSYGDYASGGLELTPNNFGVHNSSATITLTALKNLTNVAIGGAYYTETNATGTYIYDKISLTVAGQSILYQVGGDNAYKSRWTGNLSQGQTIVLTYTKDNSTSHTNEASTYFTINCDLFTAFGPGSMLKANTTSTTFDASHWEDAMAENTAILQNVKQYFVFNADTGLRIGQADDKFYVNIDSKEMGFYDASEGSAKKVVNIGNKSATIRDLTIEEKSKFNCEVAFKDFIWKYEGDGGMSLIYGG